MNPAIVISAFDRPRSIARLIESLEMASYPSGEIPLVISLDGGGGEEVARIAGEFDWKHGKKEVIQHTSNLGLKSHILSCADLTERFGSVIMLEDDLTVSPFFYEYALAAKNAYAANEKVAGISLYAYKVSENGFSSFHPIEDGKDVYLMQVASSWGQLWTDNQWRGFRTWLDKGANCQKPVPEYLDGWSDQSWKKEFIRYLIETDKWFVFPRVSLTTNHEDPGVHGFGIGRFQVPMLQEKKQWNLPQLSELRVKYNAWFNPTEETVERFGQAQDSKDGKLKTTFSIWVNVDDESGVERTLRSIQEQDWPYTIVYLSLRSEEQRVRVAQLCSILGSQMHWKIVGRTSVSERNQLLSIAEVTVELDSGGWLEKGALRSVAQVFSDLPNLAVLIGLPENSSAVNHRWNAERYIRIGHNNEVPTMKGVFFKTHILSNSESVITDFGSLLNRYKVWLVCHPLADIVYRNPLKKEEMDLMRANETRAVWRRVLTQFVEAVHPNSEFYTFLSELPDLIRYDEIHKTYYFSRA